MPRTAKRYLQESTTKIGLDEKNWKVGIYSRLSVDQDEKKSESIENQIEIIKQYIKKNNAIDNSVMNLYIYDIYIDKGKTGTDFNRAGFNRLMSDIKDHKVNCIIVKDFSRFGRDYIETGNYIEKILPFMGVRFISVNDSFDSMSVNASDKKLAMNIKNLVNDMYAKDISKKVVISKNMNQEKGVFVGSLAPYGYTIVSGNRMRRLEVDKDAAPIILKIFLMYGEEKSYNEIIAYLYENKIHRISDYRKYGHIYCESGETSFQWSQTVINKTLQNMAYIGHMAQGKHSSRLYTGQKGVRVTDKNEWIIVENTHTPIVSKELFEAVKKRIDEEKGLKNKRDLKGTELPTKNIFSDIIICSDCGKRLHVSCYVSRISNERHYGYNCRTAYYADKRKCTKKYIIEKELSLIYRAAIQKEFKLAKLKPKDLVEINDEKAALKKTEYLREMNMLNNKIDMDKNLLGQEYMRYKNNEVSRDEYLEIKVKKHKNQKIYEDRINELGKKLENVEKRKKELNTFLRSLFKAVSKEKLTKDLVNALTDSIRLDANGNVEIYFKFKGGEVRER